MSVLVEGDLEFDFSSAQQAFKFDKSSDEFSRYHVQGMKAVDFVVELEGQTLFVEIKDCGKPWIPETDRAAHKAEMRNGKLADQLGQQFRDSWMYRWAEGNTEKKITFVVIATLADQQLLPVLNDAVKRSVPLHGGGAWTRTHVSDCKVLDLARWSRLYAQFPVRRLSAQGATP